MESRNQLHVMFLPYLAPGHMMPMVDIARSFASHGINVTILTTPKNVLPFASAVDRDIKSGKYIQFNVLHFPSSEFGLPEGCENLTAAPTPKMTVKLFHAIDMLQPQVEQVFRECRPDCIVSDYLFPWTVDVAIELGIPRLAFNGSGFFNLCVAHNLEHYKPHMNVVSETESFVVPGLPDQITFTRSQLPDIVKTKTRFSALFDKLKEVEKKSFGVLVNSFYELEPAYIDHSRKVIGLKVWPIGPASLLNNDEKAERGDKPSIPKHSCLSWLDSKEPTSVVYICFGSLIRFTKSQITEMASALEESGHSFVWTIGKVLTVDDTHNNDQQQQNSWLPEGFEEKVTQSGQGLIIRGWAPQVLILTHPAIGGFLTHCGWNSIMEGISAGIPMVTWPIFAEQFYNEKLVTQALRFGVSVGNDTWKLWATEESPLINKEKIKKAIIEIMNNSNEAIEMRKKARRLRELARKAVEEGGSSWSNIKDLIEGIRSYKPTDVTKTR
ncbi:scopoletin glucosyltransferase-like [Carica papaya]|uniref:scopoletin glucosyltransferase-like n=1 Tax=Carica papaya TaxID=3649 RepID=UPI000B8CE189|nr:scopoletin glucosyltransferase-like [Carica papaya]